MLDEFKRTLMTARSDEMIADPDVSKFMAMKTALPIVLAAGSGAEVTDLDGNTYLDFCNCLNLPFGHGREESQSLSSLLNSGSYMTPMRADLMRELSGLFHNWGGIQFRSSGTESVEAAIRYAKACHGPNLLLVTFTGGFHGLPLGAQQAIGLAGDRRMTRVLPFPEGSAEQEAMDRLTEYLSSGPVLLLFETIQGSTLRHISNTFFEFVRAQKREKDDSLLLLCDDMLMSVRGGYWCSAENWLAPDLLVAGKSWSGGYPFSFFGVTKRIRDITGDILCSTTYGGNPIACEVALHTIRRLKKENILDSIKLHEQYVRANYLPRWLACSGVVSAACFGLLIGITMESTAQAAGINIQLLQSGLLCSQFGKLIRFAPPLNVTRTVLSKGLEAITQCLSKASD